MAVIQHTPHEDLPPPVSQTGIIGWFRQNLFSNWLNALLTLLASPAGPTQYLQRDGFDWSTLTVGAAATSTVLPVSSGTIFSVGDVAMIEEAGGFSS